MVDRDLAHLYGVTTKRLNEQVKRNLKRFPRDFMFQLSRRESNELVANCDRLNWLKFSSASPYVFTEQGVAMLSSVLNSDRAIEVNIQIMRVFVKFKEMMMARKDWARKIADLERKFKRHDRKFIVVFEAIRQLLKESEDPVVSKEPLGFHGKS